MEKDNVFYHRKSLVLAKLFKELYQKHGDDNELVKAIKERYIEARRQILQDENGVRYGAHEAYQALQ